jgi:hypothetical protein
MRVTKRAARGASRHNRVGSIRGVRGCLPGIMMAAVALIGLTAAPAASAATRSAAAARPAKTATAKPSATSRPSVKPRPAREQPAAPSLGEQRRLAAAAVRQVLMHSTVPDTCSGQISPDTIYPCSTPSSSGTDTFTITLTDTTDRVYVLPVSVSGNELGFTLTAPDASVVTCQQSNSGQSVCPTSQAGTYTLAVSNGGSPYTLDYTALLSDTGCSAINPSFAAPAIAGSLSAGQTGSCYTLNVPSGSVLYLMGLSPSVYPTNLDVYDSTGANQNCNLLGANTCTVGGTAPYRIFIYSNGTADTYQLQLYNLTNPQGCVATPQLAYRQVPDASSTDPCRTLTVTKAGSYQVIPVSATGTQVLGTVYASDGSVACQSFQYPFCPLAVGSYHFVLAPGQTGAPFGLVFIAADESSGCTATGDTGFKSGPATGKFAGVGEEICLTLPNASGHADFFFNQPPGGNSATSVMQVLDAKGAEQCPLDGTGNFEGGPCTLTGTAPFHIILFDGGYATAYRLLVNRTNSYAGCDAWPRSGFGGSWGATLTLSSPTALKCLVIPAGQHSTGEMIDYSNPANQVDGAIQVYDPAGNLVCTGTSMSACAYKPGVTYTAQVSTTAAKGDTYHLVRRDISAAAKCAAPRSTVVGGPSTTFTLTSDLDAVCYRVTGAAADRFWFSERTLAPVPPGGVYDPFAPATGAVLLVTNAAGATLCRMPVPYGECRVAGPKDYQLIVVAAGYAGVAITTHLDAWRVGGASGWAPQCQRHHFSFAAGWAPLSGTLTEAAAGYCAVVDVRSAQELGIYGTSNAGYPGVPYVNMYSAAKWTTLYNYFGQCGENNIGTFAYTCGAGTTDTAEQYVLLVTAGTTTPPLRYTMQGVNCHFSCSNPPTNVGLTAVSPASQPAGPDRVLTVTGTALNLGTQVAIAQNGTAELTGTPVAVNAAGTMLTVAFDTSGLTPGLYDLAIFGVGYITGVPSQGYLPNAYRVTPAPKPPLASKFTAVKPALVLDTTHGVGAPKARISAHAAVTVKVAGRAGVPAAGVTAVALTVTAINPATSGTVIVYPAGAARPGVTDLSFTAGHNAASNVVVGVRNGKITLYNSSAGKVDLTATVTGYYKPASGPGFFLAGPVRVLNTSTGLGGSGESVLPHAAAVTRITNVPGIPPTVTSVVLAVTVTAATRSGTLTVFPDAAAIPAHATRSFAAGHPVTTLVTVRVIDGNIDFLNNSSGTIQVVADLLGFAD